MSMFSTIRKGASDLRAYLQGHQKEIERLEQERKFLEESDIRFDDWKQVMLKAADLQAEESCNKMVAAWRAYSSSENGRGVRHFPIEQYLDEKKLLSRSLFFGNLNGRHPHTDLDAGLFNGIILKVLGGELKKLWSEYIEGVRSSWPADSECGPPLEKRVARIAEIEKQLDKLRAERDEALEIVQEISGQPK